MRVALTSKVTFIHGPMENPILADLNSAQRDAVTSAAAILQVLAPPGSGKTKTLTARVAYLIAHHRLKPWNIIVCTFTRKAAHEMGDRVRGLVGDEVAKQLKLGTFHSIASRYLRQYGQHIGLAKDFGIADTADSRAILKRIVKQNRFSMDSGNARNRISAQKSKGINSMEFSRQAGRKVELQEFLQIYREYEAALAASNLLDYDDLLLKCHDLLSKHPECVSNVEALLIDEFQDTNNIQYELMGLFAQQRNTITVVGDPDQSIYGFRMAEVKNLGRMKQQWANTVVINLRENYRSSGAILHAAQNIIEQDPNRPPKKLQATHSLGLRPVLRKLPSANAEARWLVSEIQRLRAVTVEMLQLNDVAILLRSAYLSRSIETALGKTGMPYRMIGGTRFYDRVEIKLALDYLRVIDQPDNSEAVARVINVPSRRVGEATVESLLCEARAKKRSLWSIILDTVQCRYIPTTKLNEPARKGLGMFVNVILGIRNKMMEAENQTVFSPADVLMLLLKKIEFQSYLKKKFPDEHEARWRSIEELLLQASEASTPDRMQKMLEEQNLPAIEDCEQRVPSTDDVLSLFLENVALTASAEQNAGDSGEMRQQITISTIHAAKGLEWPIVFIPACYDGSIPHSRAEDHDEERRLLYVGMTRAQALLYLSCPLKNSQREDAALSTFLIKPGVASFFEEHGPSITFSTVQSLAITLRRIAPTVATLGKQDQGIERDEDNYWPLNGEEPLEELARWDHDHADSSLLAPVPSKHTASFASAQVTMLQQEVFCTGRLPVNVGFTSVKAQYDELMAQAHLQRVDRRTEGRNNSSKPIGRKRQIEGQGNIANFLNGRRQSPQSNATMSDVAIAAARSPKRFKKPLGEVKNFPVTYAPSISPLENFNTPNKSLHKPRTAPLPTGTAMACKEARASHDCYGPFLSSSPPRTENDDNPATDSLLASNGQGQNLASRNSRPASTFHTTSMQQLAPQRRTLGVRRSVHGWNARKGSAQAKR